MRRTRELVLIAACASWLIACGDDTSLPPPGDAGVDDGAADGGGGTFVVAPPAAPTAPGPLTRPCPAGFAATSDGDCDPFPGGVLECGAGELQAPGEDACTRLGPACPAAGDWATNLPVAGTVRFVRAGATAGGDGSRGAPYPTIGEASRASGAGDVIAVAAGTYDEAVALRGGVVLHGACATETVIAPTFRAAASLTATGLGAIARNVTVSGRGGGVSLDGAQGLHLENVLVMDNLEFGVRVLRGAALTADGLIIAGTRPLAARGPFGRGLDVEGNATSEIHRALLDDNTDFAIFGAADAELHFTDLVVRNTRAQESDGSHGRALSLTQGATATVSRAALEDNLEIGVFVYGEGTEAILEDTVVRRVTPGLRLGGAETGIGVAVEVGAAVTARGLRVEDCHFVGIAAQGDGTSFDGEDIVIDTIGPDGRGDLGIGLAVEGRSTMRVARAVVRDTHTLGFSVKNPGAHLVAEDVAIYGVAARVLDGDLGAGLGMLRGARAEIARVHIEGTTGSGLYASDVDTHLTLSDATIIRGEVSDSRGFGVLVRDGALVDGTRIEVLDMDEIGLLVGMGGARVDLSDLVVRRVNERLLEELGLHYAAGIQVETDGAATLTRVLVDEVAHRGIASFGGTVTVIDGEVRNMVEDTPGELGYGIEAGPGAEMTLERVAVHEARAVGVVAFDEAHVVANGLRVTETRSSTRNGVRGRGVVAQGGGFIELTGVRIEGNREVGLLATGPDSRIDGRDIVIRNILENACGEEGSCPGGGGFGASAVGGTLTLTDFLVEGGALGGLQIAGGASVDLANGAIVNHPIGINIQDAPDYDFTRLMNDVRFIDNQRNVDATLIPLPDSNLSGLGLPATPEETPE